jgi:hypothetical protein
MKFLNSVEEKINFPLLGVYSTRLYLRNLNNVFATTSSFYNPTPYGLHQDCGQEAFPCYSNTYHVGLGTLLGSVQGYGVLTSIVCPAAVGANLDYTVTVTVDGKEHVFKKTLQQAHFRILLGAFEELDTSQIPSDFNEYGETRLLSPNHAEAAGIGIPFKKSMSVRIHLSRQAPNALCGGYSVAVFNRRNEQ